MGGSARREAVFLGQYTVMAIVASAISTRKASVKGKDWGCQSPLASPMWRVLQHCVSRVAAL